MKKVVALVVALTLCLVAALPAFAQGPWPTAAGTSGVTAVNMDDSAGNIVPLYIAENGTQYALPSQAVDPGEAVTWYAEPASEDSFRGAVVLSSDVMISAIGRTEWPVGGGEGAASYSGQMAGSTEVVLPQLVIEHYGTTSAFSVQNTDMDNAISVSLAFTPKGGTTFNKSMNIAAGASTTMDLGFDADFVDPAPGSNAGWIGSVKITSSTPVVAAAHTTSQAGGFVYAYDGFTNLDETEAYAPLVRRNFANLTTGIGVADASGNGGTVTIEYTGFADANGNYQQDPGEAFSDTDTGILAANGSLTFYQGDPAYSDATIDLPDRFLGSAEISVTGTGAAIAVVVNDQSDPGYGGKQTASAYSGFFADQASDMVVSPLARNEFYNFTTGISVQNVGTAEVHVDVEYTTSSQSLNASTPPDGHAVLASGQSATFYLPVDWGATASEQGWLGSAEIVASPTGSGDAEIVAITNDQDVSAPFSGDTALFNCFSK